MFSKNIKSFRVSGLLMILGLAFIAGLGSINGKIALADGNVRFCGESTETDMIESAIKTDNGKIVYANNKLGFRLNFPKTWTNMKVFESEKEILSYADGNSDHPISKGKIAVIQFTLPSFDDQGSCYENLFTIHAYRPSLAKDVNEYVEFNEHYRLGKNSSHLFMAVITNGLWGPDYINNAGRMKEIVADILPTFVSPEVHYPYAKRKLMLSEAL
jgi:hypothetical protein